MAAPRTQILMRRLPCGFKQPREIRAEVMAQLQFYIRPVTSIAIMLLREGALRYYGRRCYDDKLGLDERR